MQGVEECVADFEECFKEFSLRTSDIGKHDGYYKDRNGPLPLWAHHGEDEHKLKSGDVVKVIPMTLPPLSAIYYSFHARPEFCKPDITPHIRFDLSELVEQDKVSVQAIIDPWGTAEDQDWTKLDEKVFCINRPEEKFEEIIVIIASSERDREIDAELRVEIDSIECDECYAYISRHDYAVHKSSDTTQEWEKEARVYVTFEEAAKSPLTSRSGARRTVMYPIKSVRYLGGSALERSQSPRHEQVRKDQSMSALIPQHPAVGLDNQMINPVFLMLFTNFETGKVDYVYLPPIPVNIIWDDGKQEEFSIRGVSPTHGGGLTRPALISEDYLVTSGDGVLQLGGEGLVEEKRSDGTTSEYSKKTFTWKITRRGSAAGKR